jgi:hypothetical protein
MAHTCVNGIWETATPDETDATKRRFHAAHWVGKGAAGDDLLVTDTAGNVIVRGVAPDTNYDLWYIIPGCEWTGIDVEVLDSGTIQLIELWNR